MMNSPVGSSGRFISSKLYRQKFWHTHQSSVIIFQTCFLCRLARLYYVLKPLETVLHIAPVKYSDTFWHFLNWCYNFLVCSRGKPPQASQQNKLVLSTNSLAVCGLSVQVTAVFPCQRCNNIFFVISEVISGHAIAHKKLQSERRFTFLFEHPLVLVCN